MLADAVGMVRAAAAEAGADESVAAQAGRVCAGGGGREGQRRRFSTRGRGGSGSIRRAVSGRQGTGTFFGEEGTNPAVGESGKLEQAEEVRIETVLPMGKVEAVIKALRRVAPVRGAGV